MTQAVKWASCPRHSLSTRVKVTVQGKGQKGEERRKTHLCQCSLPTAASKMMSIENHHPGGNIRERRKRKKSEQPRPEVMAARNRSGNEMAIPGSGVPRRGCGKGRNGQERRQSGASFSLVTCRDTVEPAFLPLGISQSHFPSRVQTLTSLCSVENSKGFT